MGKLARVRVDRSELARSLWVLDIKKSAASPPRELREALKNLAGQFVKPSAQVQQFRGRKAKALETVTRAWDVIVDRNSFRYAVNREHPVIKRFGDQLDSTQLERLEVLLELLEQTFPVLDAHNRLGQDAASIVTTDQLDSAVAKAVELRPMFADSEVDDDGFIRMLASIEPYCDVEGFDTALRSALKAV